MTIGGRRKVLIVDDDPLIAEMYRLRLSAKGYEVAIARDGEEGLAMASATRPAFICLDYRLPGIDGLEALDRLRAEPATNSIPVLMLSNDGDPGMRERGLRLGALMSASKRRSLPGSSRSSSPEERALYFGPQPTLSRSLPTTEPLRDRAALPMARRAASARHVRTMRNHERS